MPDRGEGHPTPQDDVVAHSDSLRGAGAVGRRAATCAGRPAHAANGAVQREVADGHHVVEEPPRRSPACFRVRRSTSTANSVATRACTRPESLCSARSRSTWPPSASPDRRPARRRRLPGRSTRVVVSCRSTDGKGRPEGPLWQPPGSHEGLRRVSGPRSPARTSGRRPRPASRRRGGQRGQVVQWGAWPCCRVVLPGAAEALLSMAEVVRLTFRRAGSVRSSRTCSRRGSRGADRPGPRAGGR